MMEAPNVHSPLLRRGIDAALSDLTTASQFFGRQSVRDAWIAIWVMWLIWAFLFLAKHAHTGGDTGSRVDTTGGPVQNTTSGGVTQSGAAPQPTSQAQPGGEEAVAEAPLSGTNNAAARPVARPTKNRRYRVKKAHNLSRDLTLMLLLVVTLNTFGLGSGVAVLILTWIYTGFAIIWIASAIVFEHVILDLTFGCVEMALLLAMLITAYAMGWAVF